MLALASLLYSESRALRRLDALTQGVTLEEHGTRPGQTNTFDAAKLEAMTKSISEAYRDARSTSVEFHKTVIINVLLPILTALLGYIFANRERNDPSPDGK